MTLGWQGDLSQAQRADVLKLSDFSYSLPGELIAERPAATRSASRLLSLDCCSGAIRHGRFSDLQEQLSPSDLLVFNDTRVVPARLFARKGTAGRVEILLERIRSKTTALVQIRANKSPKPGNTLHLLDNRYDTDASGDELKVIEREGGFYVISSLNGRSIAELLEQYGHMPLPPYIRRADDADDRLRYQTVYSRNPGAVAAPTAGLHFDDPLMQKLREKGIDFAFLTLHVAAGTFQPVRVEEIEDHSMHTERAEVPAAVCEAVGMCKSRGGRVIAVGTTSVRSLETAAFNSVGAGGLQPWAGETDIFIYPGFSFEVVDAMITNFHLPQSTLLMLVSAFAGTEMILDAYAIAIREKYHFFSFGDAMFLYK